MKEKQKRVPSMAEIEEDINRLELGIRQLRIQYEMFFAGGMKREPTILRNNINKLVKRYNEVAIPKVAQRFRFSALVSRYNIFLELWSKRLRDMEEGDRTSRAEIQQTQENVVARCRLNDREADQRVLRKLHAQFLAARRREQKGAAKEISFERFARGVAAQTEQLRARAGCEEVELRLVVGDGDVQIKARPGR
jgi:hypothetical protein